MSNAHAEVDDSELLARMGIGGNNPPKDDIEVLIAEIEERASPLIGRFKELVASAERAPLKCEDEDTAGKLSDLILQLNANSKSLDTKRTEEKAPFLARGNAVQSFFARYTDAISPHVLRLKTVLGEYLKAKAAKEAREAAALAEQQRLEAERQSAKAQELEQQGRHQEAAAAIDRAVIAEEGAITAAKVATARPAALASARGTSGGRGGLTTRWTGTIIDRAQLDLEALRPYFGQDELQKAVNAFVKVNCKGNTGATLKGADIKQETSAIVR
jgi:hypothetical protein